MAAAGTAQCAARPAACYYGSSDPSSAHRGPSQVPETRHRRATNSSDGPLPKLKAVRHGHAPQHSRSQQDSSNSNTSWLSTPDRLCAASTRIFAVPAAVPVLGSRSRSPRPPHPAGRQAGSGSEYTRQARRATEQPDLDEPQRDRHRVDARADRRLRARYRWPALVTERHPVLDPAPRGSPSLRPGRWWYLVDIRSADPPGLCGLRLGQALPGARRWPGGVAPLVDQFWPS